MTVVFKAIDAEYLYLIVLVDSFTRYGLETDSTVPLTVSLSSAGSLSLTTRYYTALFIIYHSL